MLTNFDDFLSHSAAQNHVLGSWGFHSQVDFTRMQTQEANVWFFEQTFNFLRSFFGLVTPDNLEIITYNATQHIKLENLNQQSFLDQLMLVMKGLKEYIWTLRLNLNIVGFVRTHHDPDNPVRISIQEPCSFIAWGGPDENGFQTFSITYSLFSSTTLEGQDQMLWSINQPLLEKAIKKWEQQTGYHIDSVDSSTGDLPVFEHGFREPDYATVPNETQTTNSTQQPDEHSMNTQINSNLDDFDFGF